MGTAVFVGIGGDGRILAVPVIRLWSNDDDYGSSNNGCSDGDGG